MIRLYARNPIDDYPEWLKPFAQEWHAIQYQFYKGLLEYVEFDETKAAEFFLSKKFPKFDQKLVDQIKTQQHLGGKYFDAAKYPILFKEILNFDGRTSSYQQDLAKSSFDLIKDISRAKSPEEAIEDYKKKEHVPGTLPYYYIKFFDGIISYREGKEEFVKEIEEKIKAEVEKIVSKQ
jgi:hypothetical protein